MIKIKKEDMERFLKPYERNEMSLNECVEDLKKFIYEKQEKGEVMKKEDLKYGNVVELRNGDRCLYCTFKKGIDFIHLKGDCYTKLEYYDENLIRNEGSNVADIVKVYEDYTCQKVLWERKEIKISEDEKAILKNIDKTYKWIARDKNTKLYLFEAKPKKVDRIWSNDRDFDFEEFTVFNHLFQFIKWEDEQPYLIEDLLKEK